MNDTCQFEGRLILYDVGNVMAWCFVLFHCRGHHEPTSKKEGVSHMFALKVFC